MLYPAELQALVAARKARGVNDGARTRDNRNHNPVLYQLSYIHHLVRGEGLGAGYAWQGSNLRPTA
jgi:hypothetical protein